MRQPRSGVILQLTEQQQAIEAAFRKLPIRRGDTTKGIPYDFLIPDIARELMMMRRFDGQKKLRFAHFDGEENVFIYKVHGSKKEPVRSIKVPPSFEGQEPEKEIVIGRRVALAQKRDWAKLAKYSGEIISLLDSHDFGDLNFQPRALKQLSSLLRMLYINAREGVEHAPPSNGRSGAPEKAAAAEITERVAEHYRALTGKEPTTSNPATHADGQKPSGEFQDLLEAVFKALGIRASAVSQTKAMKQRRPLSPQKIAT